MLAESLKPLAFGASYITDATYTEQARDFHIHWICPFSSPVLRRLCQLSAQLCDCDAFMTSSKHTLAPTSYAQRHPARTNSPRHNALHGGKGRQLRAAGVTLPHARLLCMHTLETAKCHASFRNLFNILTAGVGPRRPPLPTMRVPRPPPASPDGRIRHPPPLDARTRNRPHVRGPSRLRSYKFRS